MSYPALLIEELLNQRANETHCDVKIRAGSGARLSAHACILEAGSTFFQGLFSRRPPVKELDVMETSLGKTFGSCLLQRVLPVILNTIYTGKIIKLDSEEELSVCQAFGLKHVGISLDPKVTQKRTPTSSSTLQNKEEVEMDVSFCQKCRLLFTSKEEFLAHRNKSCLRKSSCRTCGKMYSKVQALLSHLIEVRHGELICSVCDYVSESQKDLESHIQAHARVPEKPYFCLRCDSRFPNRKGLTHHLPKHLSETPYSCQICTRGFKWKHALTTHMNTHSVDKKYNCRDCGYSTSHVSTFKSHMRIHTGKTIGCPVVGCGFQTIRKQNLIQHNQTHSKEKPFQCEVCGRAFSLAKNMRRHRAVQHDRSAPRYNCELCEFQTLRSDKYVEHVRRNHPDEKDRLFAEKQKPRTVCVTKEASSASPFNSIFEPINPPNQTIDNADDTFVESAKVVSSLSETINSVLLDTNL